MLLTSLCDLKCFCLFLSWSTCCLRSKYSLYWNRNIFNFVLHSLLKVLKVNCSHIWWTSWKCLRVYLKDKIFWVFLVLALLECVECSFHLSNHSVILQKLDFAFSKIDWKWKKKKITSTSTSTRTQRHPKCKT